MMQLAPAARLAPQVFEVMTKWLLLVPIPETLILELVLLLSVAVFEALGVFTGDENFRLSGNKVSGTTVNLANRPWASLWIPAVTYRLVGLPVPPAPKTMSHNPGLATVLPAASFMLCLKAPVAGAKALMLPPPKLPISSMLVSEPNPLAGAMTTPQGALSLPLEANRLMKVPFISKTST